MDYTSSAFLAFQSNTPFYDVLKIFEPIKDEHIKRESNKDFWNINLFRIEHFKKYESITSAYEIISQISQNTHSKIDNPYLISKIISSYIDARRIYNNDPDMKSIVNIVKDHNLNYLIHGTYNGVFEWTPYAQGKTISDLLFTIDNQLVFTQIYKESDNRKKRVYGYRKKEIDYNIIE